MKFEYVEIEDAGSLVLVDQIHEGEIARDVGPQLTPNRQTLTFSYDKDGFLLAVEVIAASRVLRPEVLNGSVALAFVSTNADTVELALAAEPTDDADLMLVGPQLTPNDAGAINLFYDRSDFLVRIQVEGSGRILRSAR